MKAPLFIVGSGRCGTTLLFHALGAHPRIGLSNEAHVADFLCFAARLAALPDDESANFDHEAAIRLRGFVTRAFSPQFAALFARHARMMLVEFYDQLFPGKDLRWYGDKMPDPNVATVVKRSIPETRIITLVRDPWDYACSARSYARRRDIADAYPHLDVPVRLHAEHWFKVYSAALEREGPATPIRYEALIRDPPTVVRTVLASLELDADPACLEAAVDGAWFGRQATSPTTAASIGRATRELSQAEFDTIREVCGPVAAVFGYDASPRMAAT